MTTEELIKQVLALPTEDLIKAQHLIEAELKESIWKQDLRAALDSFHPETYNNEA